MSNDNDASNESGKPVPISQHHTGNGDNVLRDKNVFQAVSPAELQTTIRGILTSLRHRNPTQAKEQLETIKTTSNLNADSIGILNVISIIIDLADNEAPSDAYQKISTYLSATSDGLCADVAIATQIRLDAKNERLPDARERYIAVENHGLYTNEVFYEFIADRDEIEATFEANRLTLDEVELCGLIRGSLRLKNPEQSLTISKYLHDISPAFNSRVFLALSKAGIIETKLNDKHYWRISATLRRDILGLCDDAIVLLNDCKGKDARIINLSAFLLQFVFGEYKPLADACWNYISEIEVLLPEIAANIRHTYERCADSLGGVLSKIAKAQEDPSFRRTIVTEITNSKEISPEDSLLLSSIGGAEDILKWIGGGGSVSSENSLEKDFSILELKALACGDNSQSDEELRHSVVSFIGDHKACLLDINPPRLLKFANQLLDLGLSPVACELLKPHVPSKDIWASPIVCCYLNALQASQQMITLNSTLVEIDQNDWDAYIWQIKARQLDSQNNYVDAINAMEISLEKEPLSLYGWNLLVTLHKKNNSDKITIATALDLMPDEVFSRPSDLGFRLLSELAISGDFTKVEERLISWFIDEPEGCATPLTNFCLESMLGGKDTPRLSGKTSKCLGGICYSSDGQITTKLLVADNVRPHTSFLSISSPLGKLLFEMPIGEVVGHGMLDIKLIERLPPYIAVFRIASELRQELNDGRDCFHSFEMPKEPDEMFKTLERKLLSADRGIGDLNANQQIPLFMKGHHRNASSPVKAALYHLTEKTSFKHPLPGFGEEKPVQMILDVYSIIYLALTGLVHGLEQSSTKLVITIETKHFLEEWLGDITREDYLTVGVLPGGGLWRNNAEDIQRQTAEIQDAVNSIIAKAEVVSPNLVDMPPDILRIQDLVDLSVFSCIKLSIANDIPWLCIDLFFAQLLKTSGYRTINAHQFFSFTGRELPLDQKKHGLYLHASAALPYPLTFEDMMQLSKSKDDHDHYFLAELLKMYPNAFSDTESAIRFLHQILVSILSNAYIDGEILNALRGVNPRNNGYAERVFNACCFISIQCNDGQEAEEKLALLLNRLFVTFGDMPSMNELIRVMASLFISGHFMSFSAINKYMKEIEKK